MMIRLTKVLVSPITSNGGQDHIGLIIFNSEIISKKIILKLYIFILYSVIQNFLKIRNIFNILAKTYWTTYIGLPYHEVTVVN